MDKVSIQAITWNMGNTKASDKAVNGLIANLKEEDSLPDIVAVSTQEECAREDERLQIKLLEKLNEDIQDPRETYRLIRTCEPQYHTTMAGAGKSPSTLIKALATDHNRVSCALLVKCKYAFENAQAMIDFKEGKESGNKSIITIRGTLKDEENHATQVVISGGHWDSFSEQKRRDHSNQYLEGQGLQNIENISFDEIYHEASKVRILMGDFNERHYRMTDGSIHDPMLNNLFRGYGFNVHHQPNLRLGEMPLEATYGFRFHEDNPARGLRHKLDPRSRPHVAKAGFLDRVAYCSGLNIKSSYNTKLNPQLFVQKRKSWYYAESDHVPVMRKISYEPAAKADKENIVGAYLLRRLPDLNQDIERLSYLYKNCDSLNTLVARIKHIQYHDSSYHPVFYLNAITDTKKCDYYELMEGIEKKLAEKKQIEQYVQQCTLDIAKAMVDKNRHFLEVTFEAMTRLSFLKNEQFALLSIEDEKVCPKSEKLVLIRESDKLLNQAYLCVLSHLVNPNSEPFSGQLLDHIALEYLKKQNPDVYKPFLKAISDINQLLNAKRFQEVHNPKSQFLEKLKVRTSGLFFGRFATQMRESVEVVFTKKSKTTVKPYQETILKL